jgi:hypothetical protein
VTTKLLPLLFFYGTLISLAQNSSEKVIWISHSENIDNEYTVQFKYPSYYKFDWIENGLCLGKTTKSNEYGNTMDWGIWMIEPHNYKQPNPNNVFFKDYFLAQKDTLVVSSYKAIRTILQQRHGRKYKEDIAITFPNCVFEIENQKTSSDDFKTFYNSIIITKK